MEYLNLLSSIMEQKLVLWGISALRVALILFLFYFIRRIITHFLDSYCEKAIEHKKTLSLSETNIAIVRTVAPIIRSAIHLFLGVLTILLVLSELNINIMPIVYSLSILGLAFSIGSQTLVKDFINGLITLIEGSIAVGDYVTIRNSKGLVETMSLRCIHLRHVTGEIETIPFSEITHVVNHSRDFSLPLLTCTVSFDADMGLVESCFRETFEIMRKDASFSDVINGDLHMAGISKISAEGLTVVAYVKISPDPGQHFLLTFYKFLAETLKKRGVPMPLCSCCSGQKNT
jgi:small-conductance mechanosensitive channel